MDKKNRGGSRPGSGRKTKKEKGLEPTKPVNFRVEVSVIEACKEKHGSLSNALRFAAKSSAGMSQ